MERSYRKLRRQVFLNKLSHDSFEYLKDPKAPGRCAVVIGPIWKAIYLSTSIYHLNFLQVIIISSSSLSMYYYVSVWAALFTISLINFMPCLQYVGNRFCSPLEKF